MRILVVEDEPKVAQFIQNGLIEEQFAVDLAADGAGALQRIRTTAYDLLILDVMLPDVDGFGVCRQVRALGLNTPILMLSARSLIDDRVRGLDSGADDYLTKPFDFAELSARVRALLRRHREPALVPLSVADLTLDPVTRLVKRGARRVDLTAKEFALLEYLMRHAGQALTRQMIADHVWGFTWDRLTNVIDVFVNHVRKKLDRLQRAFESLRQFAGDVSHQIQTPLTVIRGALDAALRQPGRASDPAWLRGLADEVEDIGAIMVDLRSLALADAPIVDMAPVIKLPRPTF